MMDGTNVRVTSIGRSARIEQENDYGDLDATDLPANEDEFQAKPTVFPNVPRSTIPAILAKRGLDIMGAITSFLVFLPVMLTIAIIIRTSGKPIIFAHQRVGEGRRMFGCYKFRSMIPDAEKVLQKLLQSDPQVLSEWQENHKLRNDPRITKFGQFLRKSSLDELPQLWNVLKGEMSLVGPRPIVEEELKHYGEFAPTYLAVRPGMTGLWQVIARSNCTYSRRVSLDKLYVKNKSIRLDIWILWKTIGTVIRRVGAV